MKPFKTFLLLMTGMMLVACESGDSSESGGSDPRAAERIGEGLEPGGHELATEGSARVIGAYGGDRGPTEFRPARSDGSNAEGPYTFRVRAMTERDGEEIMAYALLEIPEGSGPGTYELTRSGDNATATAMLRSTAQAWVFARDVEGTLEIAELGEHLTAAFEYRAHDGDGDAVDVQGRVYRIAFEPQLEVHGAWVVNGESANIEGQQARMLSDTLVIGPLSRGLIFSLPADLAPGDYALSTSREDGTIRVTRTPINEQTVSGHMQVERDGEHFNGRFELTAEGDDETFSANGEFQYLKLE